MPATLGATFFTVVLRLKASVPRRVEDRKAFYYNKCEPVFTPTLPLGKLQTLQYKRYSTDAVPLKPPALSMSGLWRMPLPYAR